MTILTAMPVESRRELAGQGDAEGTEDEWATDAIK